MTAYNQLRYSNLPIPNTHPSRLFVLAKLAGLEPAPLATCRVLELGASEGVNLIGMAVGMPNAEFVGLDLAAEPVARGQRVIQDLGLRNISLRTMDLMDVDESLGQFDYILTHGIYGWTPAFVGEKVLGVSRMCLAPHGLAFVSYNTSPAGHIRKMLREMMLFHVRGIQGPDEQLKAAREFLTVMAMGRPEPEAFDVAAAAYAQTLLQHSDSALFHDDLAPLYEPVSISEFCAHASTHRLQYCCEATGFDAPRNLKPEAIAAVEKFSAGDAAARRQYFDFLRMRGFHQSLLCHESHVLEPQWRPEHIVGCFAYTTAVETDEGAFASADNVRMSTTHPVPIAFMRRLIEARPLAIEVTEEDAHVALELFKVGIIELHGAAGYAQNPGEKPCASPLVRYQLEQGHRILTTLWHRPLEVDDESSRAALASFDGTRDQSTLRAAMNCSQDIFEREIWTLGRLGLLVG